jgi:hypothetical protein
MATKTLYEKRAKYSLNNYIFGKPKRKNRWVYFLLFLIFLGIGLILNYIMMNFILK